MKQLRTRILTLLLTAATLSAMLSGCRSTQRTISTRDTSKLTLTEKAHDIASGNISWTQLNLPLKLSLKSPKKASLNGRIYMRRNHDIYITLRMLGMEVANMYINTDSIYVADKMNKYYIAEPVKSVFANAAISIGDMQDALTGRAFVNNCGTYSDALFDHVALNHSSGNTWTLTPKSKINGNIGYQFKYRNDNNDLISLVFSADNKQYICKYYEPVTIDNARFMKQFHIATDIGDTDIEAYITFDFDKVKYQVPENARWRWPDKYKRITIDALINAIDWK